MRKLLLGLIALTIMLGVSCKKEPVTEKSEIKIIKTLSVEDGGEGNEEGEEGDPVCNGVKKSTWTSTATQPSWPNHCPSCEADNGGAKRWLWRNCDIAVEP